MRLNNVIIEYRDRMRSSRLFTKNGDNIRSCKNWDGIRSCIFTDDNDEAEAIDRQSRRMLPMAGTATEVVLSEVRVSIGSL